MMNAASMHLIKSIVHGKHLFGQHMYYEMKPCIFNRLQDGQQPLQQKGRGHLIHVSDFINSETGRLILQSDDSVIT